MYLYRPLTSCRYPHTTTDYKKSVIILLKVHSTLCSKSKSRDQTETLAMNPHGHKPPLKMKICHVYFWIENATAYKAVGFSRGLKTAVINHGYFIFRSIKIVIASDVSRVMADGLR